MTHTQAEQKAARGEAKELFKVVVVCPMCRRAHAWRPFDQVLAVLKILGPMTLRELAAHCRRSPRVVAAWLYHCRKRGSVKLIRRSEFWTDDRHKRRCGKWAIV